MIVPFNYDFFGGYLHLTYLKLVLWDIFLNEFGGANPHVLRPLHLRVFR
jgi:hypothetical protein